MPNSAMVARASRYDAVRRLVSRGLKSGPRHVLKRLLRLRRVGTLSDQMIRLNHAEAKVHDVAPTIHPGDFMYWFCCNHPELTLEQAIRYYFWDGGRSAGKLASILAELGLPTGRPIKLLEFASGYGCVTRHIKKNPDYDIVSCDIHPQAVDFLRERIGVQAIQSVHSPEEFATTNTFDVVFALSFFSHMPRRSFGRWLQALYGSLSAPGYLVFTTHGLKSCEALGITPDEVPADGFWFSAHSEQSDLDATEYGSTLCTPDFVIREVNRSAGASIAMFKHAHWWEHQDLFVVKRER
jgi:SAM-dependent methyltransferase